MFFLYRAIVTLLFYCCLPFLLAYVLITGKHRQGLAQRFASYSLQKVNNSAEKKMLWLHAASVGEVQAARTIISQIQEQMPTARIVLTVMTLHGREFAESQLGNTVECLLAPLDIPGIVERAIRAIEPDLYICIETELWPVLIDALHRQKVRVCLLNGRLSPRSFSRYKRARKLVGHTLGQFDKIAVISEADRERYLFLGAKKEDLVVEGNVKYDLNLPENSKKIADLYRKTLQVNQEKIVIAGSTHGDEELQLITILDKVRESGPTLMVLAPRHPLRTPEIIRSLKSQGVSCQLFSALKSGKEQRNCRVIIVDTMGELSLLYGVADYVFCGGSLVEKGGHNLMEVAIWGKAVFYGPHMDDFRDAAHILESVDAGFQVADAHGLSQLLQYYHDHPVEYGEACRRAREIARKQQGSSARQLAYILPS